MAHPPDPRSFEGYERLLKALEREFPGKKPKTVIKDLCGLKQPTVSIYKKLPAAHLAVMCRAAKIPPWQVRPDLFSRDDWETLNKIPEVS